MTTYVLAPQPFGFAGTENYLVQTYAAGGLVEVDTWLDEGDTLNANPVVFDANGAKLIYVIAGVAYRFRVRASVDGVAVGAVLEDYEFTAANPDVDLSDAQALAQWLCFDICGETETLTTGTAKRTFWTKACTILAIPYATVTTVSSSGLPTFDVNVEAATILGAAKLSIDASENVSFTAATPTTLVTTVVADNSKWTIDCDVAGTGAKGAKVYVYVLWSA